MRPLVPPVLGKIPYLWLIYLCFFYIRYVHYYQGTWFEVLLAIATGIVFVRLFFASLWAEGRESWGYVLTTLTIGLVWTPFNIGASTFYIFAAGMTAGLTNPRECYALISLSVVAAGVMTWFLHLPSSFWIPGVFVTGVVGVAAVMATNLGRSRHALYRKQEELQHMTKLAERERISRDLHDLLGHSLSVVALKAELARKLISRDPDRAEAEIRDVENAAREALSQVRQAVLGYRSSGLRYELDAAKATLGTADVATEFVIEPVDLPPECENVFAIAVREAVTNVVRHAEAKNCRISLQRTGTWLKLTVADDGNGMGEGKPGCGLTGMRERVEVLGGHVQLEGNSGTTVIVQLPVGEDHA